MYLIVDAKWAREHPREAARIQVAHLLRRLRDKRRMRPQEARQGGKRT